LLTVREDPDAIAGAAAREDHQRRLTLAGSRFSCLEVDEADASEDESVSCEVTFEAALDVLDDTVSGEGWSTVKIEKGTEVR
jgi:hypothetical protein